MSVTKISECGCDNGGIIFSVTAEHPCPWDRYTSVFDINGNLTQRVFYLGDNIMFIHNYTYVLIGSTYYVDTFEVV